MGTPTVNKVELQAVHSPPVLHSNCVKCEPVCAARLRSAAAGVSIQVAIDISKLDVSSCKRTSSQDRGSTVQQNCSRNSTLKMRLVQSRYEVNTLPCAVRHRTGLQYGRSGNYTGAGNVAVSAVGIGELDIAIGGNVKCTISLVVESNRKGNAMLSCNHRNGCLRRWCRGRWCRYRVIV